MNKMAATRRRESFNNKFFRHILGITNAQQRIDCITIAQVRRKFGVEEVIEDVPRDCAGQAILPVLMTVSCQRGFCLARFLKGDLPIEPSSGGRIK